MIKLTDVYHTYGTKIHSLKGITLSVDDGEFAFLIGPSGAGKSTLLKILTCEQPVKEGQATVNGYNLDVIRKREIPYFRRSIGVVFQDLRLMETKSAYENVAFAMEVTGASRAAIKERVPYVFSLVGLSKKMHRSALELSGGEQQRIAIARALVNNPKIIIADEPTGNLDPDRSLEIMTLLEKINSLGTTILVITHEKNLVDHFNKRVITLENGRIISDEMGGYYTYEEMEY